MIKVPAASAITTPKKLVSFTTIAGRAARSAAEWHDVEDCGLVGFFESTNRGPLG